MVTELAAAALAVILVSAGLGVILHRALGGGGGPRRGLMERYEKRELALISEGWLAEPRKKRELALRRARQRGLLTDDDWIDEPWLMEEGEARAMWDALRAITDRQYRIYIEEGRVVSELFFLDET